MDLRDQLKNLFPEHQEEQEGNDIAEKDSTFWVQDAPLLCKYEKRKGKPNTIIEGYQGSPADFKILTKLLKQQFNCGGSYKDDVIVIQGNFRDDIMVWLRDQGFQVKRVGG